MWERYVAQVVIGLATATAIFLWNEASQLIHTVEQNNALLKQLVERGNTIDRLNKRTTE